MQLPSAYKYWYKIPTRHWKTSDIIVAYRIVTHIRSTSFLPYVKYSTCSTRIHWTLGKYTVISEDKMHAGNFKKWRTQNNKKIARKENIIQNNGSCYLLFLLEFIKAIVRSLAPFYQGKEEKGRMCLHSKFLLGKDVSPQ